MNEVSTKNKIKECVLSTYTPENYYKLFMYAYAMVGEGFIAAETLLLDQMNLPNELWDYQLDIEANKFLTELEGDN